MPNSIAINEARCKQPTGSSKRKRKQSIKRNIVQDNEVNGGDPVKTSAVEKTYGKRVKCNKGKAGKDADEGNPKKEEKNNESSCQKIKKEENLDLLHTDAEEEKNEKPKCKLGGADVSKCSFTKQQCQNCKFCSEHRVSKDSDDSNSKRTKKKFPCEICAKEGSPKVYNSMEKHKHHMATVHEIYSKELKRFECTECPETVWFPTKSKFTYHLGTKHPGIIKFICEVCTETFKLKANYKTHMKTHNIVVQKKFSCEVCNGTFVNKAGFEAHKKRFPGPHIKQSCSHCGFSFSREKHLINHRCKTLLLEEAAARANNANQVQPLLEPQEEDPLKLTAADISDKNDETQTYLEKKATVEVSTDTETLEKKARESDSQINKRVVLHRIIPRRNQDQTVYRPVQMQTQNVTESVGVQELREIDFEGGTFIAAATGEPEQQFIIRDIDGHLVQGNQIIQLAINDVQPGEESQVYLAADWNFVAPYVIREKSP